MFGASSNVAIKWRFANDLVGRYEKKEVICSSMLAGQRTNTPPTTMTILLECPFTFKRYMKKNTNKSITVNDIAAHFGYSRTYLSHRFKNGSGMNLSHFITMCKLEEAKILLKRTNKPISEISNFLCFSSQSHFQTAFKKHCGCTPASFRKKK